MEMPADHLASPCPQAAWKLAWLTPARARLIFAALMLFGLVSHLNYLRNHCPIDLSGDEAQYWDWSRKPDICYYSKGPLVAWIIRASTSLFGDVMWAVRLPAVILAVATSCVTYWLTLRLFKSDRLALGVTLLNHVVPMFVAGSILMTIDPPYFFCWGLATAFLALAAIDDKPWAWIGAGLAVGIGTLAKYGMLLWPLGMFAFLIAAARWKHPTDPFRISLRRALLRPGPWLATLIGLTFLSLPIIWNARNGWVSFRHVAHQTGATGAAAGGNFFEFFFSQIAILGPALAPILIGALIHAWRQQFRGIGVQPTSPSSDPSPLAIPLLLWSGLPLMLICLLGSLRTKMQLNWPAAAYFGWMILTAHFLATRMASPQSWKRWRGWLWGAIVFGIIMMPIAHDFEIAYPVVSRVANLLRKNPVPARGFDPTAKLKGWQELGNRVSDELARLDNGFVIAARYQPTALLAFYVKGQPRTFCLGPYLADPRQRDRRSQYDIWPDRRLDQPHLVGRSAIYVGDRFPDLDRAFDKVERLPDQEIHRRGSLVERFELYRCTNFKGLALPGSGKY